MIHSVLLGLSGTEAADMQSHVLQGRLPTYYTDHAVSRLSFRRNSVDLFLLSLPPYRTSVIGTFS